MEVHIFLLCLYIYLSIVLVQCLNGYEIIELLKPPDLLHLNSSCTRICAPPFNSNLICRNNTCVCKEGFYPDYEQDKCISCPGILQACDVCCQKGLVCNFDGLCQHAISYVTSSIAFGVAIVLGVVALGSVIWKVFISSYRFERNAAGRASQTSNNSMNSIQRLVNERLQNRPPSYAETIQQQRTGRRALDDNRRDHVEAPPPYTLFCREPSNMFLAEFYNNIDDKENSPTELATEDTVVHI